MEAAARKRHGVHYTPKKLARFLAEQTVLQLGSKRHRPIRIMDPACGEGELLIALLDALPYPASQIEVIGVEQDLQAARAARNRLAKLGLDRCEIKVGDFLQQFSHQSSAKSFDVVIANPPYVRTQVLGGKQAQKLAKQFGLTGRVDLYQVFAIAMSNMLNEGGVLGLLTSNRFLTVKSGLKLRQRLMADFELRQIFDLGDTKLFEAAVLPVIVTAVKNQKKSIPPVTGFHRVYQSSETNEPVRSCRSFIQALSDPDIEGIVQSDEGRFLIERGQLSPVGDESIWTLSNQISRKWLAQVRSNQATTFGEVAEIKVGIKTTADRVFVREDWNTLPDECRPESVLVRPLITHHDAERWRISEETRKTVLYPYQRVSGQRRPIALKEFPRGAAYLQTNRQRLVKRKYLIDAGRKWYEIWVPHQPQDWEKPKIVWPDISQEPKFFLDDSGAIVNGDCYWNKLRPGVDPDWIYMMLAVANSIVATTFYDTVFHNKLYAGRRRFMTQYVKEFPLPDKNSPLGRKIIQSVKQMIEKPSPHQEKKIERLVCEIFGLSRINSDLARR